MLHTEQSHKSDGLVLSRDCLTSSERGALRARVQRGELVRVAPGAYCGAVYWRELDRHERYRYLIDTAAGLDSELVFSHAAAASLWRLPWVGAWPARVDVIESQARGGTSTTLLARHTVGRPETVEVIDGLRVTTLARTVVDLAAQVPFGPAVCLADAALRRNDHPIDGMPMTRLAKAGFISDLERIPVSHGRSRATRVIVFADGRSDRPGESLSRVTMHAARIPAPELQVELRGASGRRYVVDFWWPLVGAFGEFDGRFKYSDPTFLRGRTPEQALYDEKLREDDLRAVGRSCARWNWEVARSVPLLRARLATAGIR